MTKEYKHNFQLTNKCHICNQLYNEKNIRAKDHCHITGKYGGSAGHICTANYRPTHNIPVIFHNLRGCESHHLMQEIGTFGKKFLYHML